MPGLPALQGSPEEKGYYPLSRNVIAAPQLSVHSYDSARLMHTETRWTVIEFNDDDDLSRLEP